MDTEVLNAISKAMQIAIDETNKNLKSDKTIEGIVKAIDGTKCTVIINGSDQICDIVNGILINVGDVVKILSPQNNYSQSFVYGKLGTVGGGSVDPSTLAKVATTGDYNDLINKPTTYTYNQNTPSNKWIILHELNKAPSVTIVDSAGSTVIGKVVYISLNEINVIFNNAFSGTAYLN